MRDKIAEIIHGIMYGSVKQDLAAADAIIAALPDMIAPLVWTESIYYKNEISGKYTAQYEHNDNYSSFWTDGDNDFIISSHRTMAAAKDAANAHHRAAIMAAFKGENT